MKSDPVQRALAAIAAGRMVVVVDDPDRENEGDLVVAAEHVTPEKVNFMATHGRGLICVPMRPGRLHELGIGPMVSDSTDPKGTAFHVGVDAAIRTSTGISARDRCETIRLLADPRSRRTDFSRPGHVFPLAAQSGGVLRRRGHTEAAVDLCQLAGCEPAAVICEIQDAEGEMMRLPELLEFATEHRLPIISVQDLVDHRVRHERRVARAGSARIPLAHGEFRAIGYVDRTDAREHLAVVMGDVGTCPTPLVRVHSECLTGDVLGSRRCDCGRQLELALQMIAGEGVGVLVYIRGHEGRGIGLLKKLSAYELQDEGLDTVEANLALGHPADAREYVVAAEILRELGVAAVRLITNNPAKRADLESRGISVLDCVPALTEPTAENVSYLATKGAKLGHLLAESRFPHVR